MKKIFKENLKIILIVVITAIIVSSTTVFAYSIIASNVGFTPKDSSWDVENTKEALDNLNLRANQLTSNYSLEEKKIGKWIDGSPVYQIVLKNTSMTHINANTWTKYYYAADLNIKDLVDGRFGRFTSEGTVSDIMNDISVWYDSDSKYVEIYRLTSEIYFREKSFVVIQYTKTTD